MRKSAIAVILLSLVTGVGFALGWSEPSALRSVENSPATAGGPSANDSDDDADGEVVETEKTDFEMKNKMPWRAPDYRGQTNALGWSEDIFTVPAGLEARFNFWRDIYTKYSTDQGLIHDTEHVSVIYAAIDFRPIMNNAGLTEREKNKARRNLVNDKKKEIRARLERLARVKSPDGLDAEDLHIWGMYSSVDEPGKFIKAQHRKRLRFQLGQSDRFLQGIYYSGRYIPEMEKIFRERGLPIELTRLPFVESSFNVNARSRVGASGIWQFMRYTGRKFMRINYAVDERNDPIRSAEAAARMFRINYEMLGKWSLAITGYNHGPAGVQRIVKKFQTDNIVDLVDERNGRFGFASANFYACFLAALDVEKNASKYFGDKLYWDTPFDARDIKLTRSVNRKALLKWFDGSEAQAKAMNMHLLRSFWTGFATIGAKNFIRVPSAKYEVVSGELQTGSAELASTSAGNSNGNAEGIEYYLINQGETLSEIAAQLGVRSSVLLELNGIENPRSLRAGQKIMIPAPKNNK